MRHSCGIQVAGAITASTLFFEIEFNMPPMLFTALIGLVFNLFFSGVLPGQHQAGAFKFKDAISIGLAHRQTGDIQ